MADDEEEVYHHDPLADAHYADEMNDTDADEKKLVPVVTEDEMNENGIVDAAARQSSGIIPQFQNIVATVSLGCRLDLKQIAMRARNAEYNPKKFSAVTMRIRNPKTTALVFSTGKIVVTGANDIDEAKVAARKYARIIQRIGFEEVRFLDFTIQNMVASCDVRFPIRLEGLAYDHEEYCSYEPELFPGLIYRMQQPTLVLLIFVSGKVVITGAKSREAVIEAFENIYPVLTEYRKESHAT